jgi:hypothetical protein
MSKHPRRPTASQDTDDPSSDRAPDDTIGDGRRTVLGRFKPGQTGNPKGRPKKQRNLRTVLETTLNQRIIIREGNRSRSITKLDGIVLSIVNKSLQGDGKAQSSLFTLLRSAGMIGESPEAATPESLTPDDGALIADYIRRLGADRPAGPASTDGSTVGDPPSADRRPT